VTPADPLASLAANAPEQLPGQIALPGLEPDATAGPAQRALPGLEELPPDPGTDEDPARDRVAEALRAADPDSSRLAAAIRDAFDLLLDGQHTGRYRWDQLHKTEKTHAGTLVEIGIQRRLGLADGTTLDYSIAGAEVDCKFSHRSGGWMIPPEAEGRLLLLVQASDDEGTWSAGLVRAREEYLRQAGNRDHKRALNDAGRAGISWLSRAAALPENALLRLPERDVTAIFGWPKGQQRVNELFRRALGRRISRAVVATVARQDDPMKRVRGGGGARDQLRGEGIVIFGDYAAHQALAVALGLPAPGPGEFVSARLARRGEPAERGLAARYIRLDGCDWVIAGPADPTGPAPQLPRV
jgi:Restriction endonuclease NaeI